MLSRQSDHSASRCAPLATDNATFCSLDDMAANITVGCDYERFIKDQQPLQAEMARCSHPHVDVWKNRESPHLPGGLERRSL